ncbi:MAG: thioredoxin domain-containing protein [Gammaproteobacteria bacterium]
MASLKIPVGPHDHTQGNAKAAVTLLEYGDYQCPSCGAAYPVVKQLQAQFADTLCFVFRNFPLTEMHPDALSAAMTAEFAGAHGPFWAAHDALYENQQELGWPLYQAIATRLHLPTGELRSALEAGAYEKRIRTDFNGGVRSGVNGTPTFFINGRRYDGPATFDDIAETIKQLRK